MNSRQINFFLTALDQNTLLEDIRSGGDFLVINAVTQGGVPDILEGPEIIQMGYEHLKVFLAQPDELNSIRFNSISNRDFKTVDVVRSPVIELARCFHIGNIIRRGRLYVVTSYYEQGSLRKKNNEFIRWAGRVLTKARKSLIKDHASSTYFGREALQLKTQGTEFVIL
jgi:hypothetical protein